MYHQHRFHMQLDIILYWSIEQSESDKLQLKISLSGFTSVNWMWVGGGGGSVLNITNEMGLNCACNGSWSLITCYFYCCRANGCFYSIGITINTLNSLSMTNHVRASSGFNSQLWHINSNTQAVPKLCPSIAPSYCIYSLIVPVLAPNE